jgi:hypothetical protein
VRRAEWIKAAITFDRDYMLDLGGVRVRFLVVGPTHTRGDTALLVEGDGVLVPRRDSGLEHESVAGRLRCIEQMRPRIIVPSHGVVGDPSIIGGNRAIMLGVQRRALELKAQGRSSDDTAMTVQKEFQAMHPDWPRGNGLAAAARAAYAEAP